jgi:ADP-heptose:LPS heptosyltransferase
MDMNDLAPPRVAGIGDVVETVIKTVTFNKVRPCGGCRRRRNVLNRILSWPTCPGRLKREKSTLLLEFHHGFGDAVQFTTVLQHLQTFFDGITIDVACKMGIASLFRGLCRDAFLLGSESHRHRTYDLRKAPRWFEPEVIYDRSPSTKAQRCLVEEFGIEPRIDLCGYRIHPDAAARQRAADYLRQLPAEAVLLHYQGNSARAAKNLDEQIAASVVRVILDAGLVPVILDWDRRSQLRSIEGVWCPGADHPLWNRLGTGDGATLAALAEGAAYTIGIDSGPGHVFGAVNTPGLIVWRHHHPLHYFGVSHLLHVLPRDHQRLVYGDWLIAQDLFESRYRHHVRRQHLRYELPRLVSAALQESVAEKRHIQVS